MPEPEKRRGGGKPYRSKLEPFFEEIRAARKARKTWAEIAEQLNPRVETTAQGVFYFFKSKRRKKYALGMEPDEPDQAASDVPPVPAKPADPPQTTNPAESGPGVPAPTRKQARPDLAQQNAAIEALRAKAKQPPPEDDPDWDFSRDLDKPI